VAVIRWGFIAFLLVVVVMLFIVIPSATPASRSRGSPRRASSVGLVTGILSGLLGVGGGIIVVPALILLFGTSDLIAKGTSLLMMIPTAISGTIGNLRAATSTCRRRADRGRRLYDDGARAWIATLLDPLAANILFAVFIVFIATQMAVRAIRARRTDR
jgi:uncharacterized membrane protein YfcA